MAWDDHEIGGVWFLSGDKPFDEMAGVVSRLHNAFLDRWGRPPYLAELLYPLLCTAGSGLNAAVADEQLPSVEALLQFVGGPTAADHIEPGDYEGGSDGESDDFLIWPRSSQADLRAALVLRCVVNRSDTSTVCRYELLSPTITDRAARCLIRYCVLDALLGYDLTDHEHPIRFERRI